ncbi:MAG: hypothetical protein R3D71_05160 [Rickettsiales bacterium]
MKKFLSIILLWLMAIAISTTSFYFHWNHWPDIAEMIIGHTLYALLAMPFSFLHTITFFDGSALRVHGLSFIMLLIGYWAVLIYLHIKYLRTEKLIFILFLGVILIISAIKWLYYSVGMIGI